MNDLVKRLRHAGNDSMNHDCIYTPELIEAADALELKSNLYDSELRHSEAMRQRVRQLETAIWKYWSDHGLVDGSNLQGLAKEMQRQLTAGNTKS